MRAARGENIPAWDCTSSKKPLCPLMLACVGSFISSAEDKSDEAARKKT